MEAPVAEWAKERYTVALFGGHGSFKNWHLFAKSKGIQNGIEHLVLPPSRANQAGFQTIVHQSNTYVVNADGITVPHNTARAIRSRDCPIVTAYNPLHQQLAVCHAGRPALTPPADCGGCSHTVIAALLQAVAPRGTDASQVMIYITGGICGSCFQHNEPEAEPLIRPFRARYPSAIVATYGLDLIEVIRNECTGRGVKPEHIYHDGLCTKEHPLLSSKRGGDSQSNTVVVIHH